jgi:hypothetical protein
MVVLKEFLGSTVIVRLRNGISCEVKVTRFDHVYNLEGLPFHDNRYIADGVHCNYKCPSYDVIAVNNRQGGEIVEWYNKRIGEAEKDLAKLKCKLAELERQEEFRSDLFTPIKDSSQYENCLDFLKNTESVASFEDSFRWSETPQGEGYWVERAYDGVSFSKEDLQCIRNWLVNYLIKRG